mmetsp:Transcript_75698/g.225672  ORF Transcript_75698/g.225672 Transcript_75698/m.225672 type:complete len:216 (-) Transcript_75698:319-966(-)
MLLSIPHRGPSRGHCAPTRCRKCRPRVTSRSTMTTPTTPCRGLTNRVRTSSSRQAVHAVVAVAAAGPSRQPACHVGLGRQPQHRLAGQFPPTPRRLGRQRPASVLLCLLVPPSPWLVPVLAALQRAAAPAQAAVQPAPWQPYWRLLRRQRQLRHWLPSPAPCCCPPMELQAATETAPTAWGSTRLSSQIGCRWCAAAARSWGACYARTKAPSGLR